MESSKGINALLNLLDKQAQFPRGGDVAILIRQLEDLIHLASKTLNKVRQAHCVGNKQPVKKNNMW